MVAFWGSVAPVQDSLKGCTQLWQKLAVIPELHASGSTGYACSAQARVVTFVGDPVPNGRPDREKLVSPTCTCSHYIWEVEEND